MIHVNYSPLLLKMVYCCYYYCVHDRGGVCATAHVWRLENNFVELTLSCLCFGSGNQTQVTWPGHLVSLPNEPSQQPLLLLFKTSGSSYIFPFHVPRSLIPSWLEMPWELAGLTSHYDDRSKDKPMGVNFPLIPVDPQGLLFPLHPCYLNWNSQHGYFGTSLNVERDTYR